MAKPRSVLPGQGSVCGMALDIGGDGYDDIAVAAVAKGDEHPDAQSSFIIWNGPKGFNSERTIDLPALYAYNGLRTPIIKKIVIEFDN